MSLSERLIDGVNALSLTWAEAMVRACWQGGLALLAAWGICALLARRSGRAQCWFWRMGYAKFLLCVAFLTPLSLPLLPVRVEQKAPRPEAAAVAESRPPAAESSYVATADLAPMSEASPVMNTLPLTRVVEAPTAPALRTAIQTADLSVQSWIMLAWAMGVAVCAYRVARAWWKTRALRQNAEAVEEGTLDQACVRLAARTKVGKLPELLAAEGLASPLLVGVRRPAIVLPARLAERCGREQMELILAHEMAHLRRRDLLWNLLQTMVSAIFFFHPLVWLTRGPWMLAQELACDEMALAATGAHAAEFGRVLLVVVAEQKVARQRLLGVGVAESGGTVRRRLIAMRNGLGWSRRHVALVATAAGIVGVVGLIPWRVVAQEAPGAIGAQNTPAELRSNNWQEALESGGHADVSSRVVPSFGGMNTFVVSTPTAPPMPTAAPAAQNTTSTRANVDPTLPTGMADGVQARMNARRATQMGDMISTTAAQNGTPAVDKRNTPVMTGADPNKIQASDKWITQVIPLKYADAVRLRNDLSPMFSPDATVTVGQESNSIVVTDTAAHVKQILEIIAALDTPSPARGDLSGPGMGAAPRAPGTARVAANAGENFYAAQVSAPINEIAARVDGTLMDVAVKDGQTVKKGDVLFKFDPQAAQRALDVARARVSMAQAKLEQQNAAAKVGAGGMAEVKQSEAALMIEQSELNAKLEELSLLTILSPSDGVIMLGDTKAGQFVSRGSSLAKVVNLNDLSVTTNIAQMEVDKIKVGQKVVFVAGPTTQFACEITSISPLVDTATGTIAVRGRLTGGAGQLRPGQYGNLKLAGNP